MLRSLMGTIVARRSLSSNNSSNDSHPLERRIGSKKDFPAAIQAADAKVYNLALNGAGVDDHVEEDKDQPHRGGGGGGRVRPLFGVIPAQAAVLDFIRNDLNFDPNLVSTPTLALSIYIVASVGRTVIALIKVILVHREYTEQSIAYDISNTLL